MSEHYSLSFREHLDTRRRDLEAFSPGLLASFCPNPNISDPLESNETSLLEMALAISSALQYLHAQGIVHRGLTVDNVSVGPGGIVLTDYG